MLNDSVLLRLRLPPFAPFFADFFAGVFAILFFFFCVCVYINILRVRVCVCARGGGVVGACGRKHTLCYVDKDCLVEHCKHRTIHIFPRQWYSVCKSIRKRVDAAAILIQTGATDFMEVV